MNTIIHLYAINEDDAINIFKENIKLLNIDKYIKEIDILEIEPYWKIESIYVLVVEIYLKINVIKMSVLESFLNSLCDKYDFYGDSILISKNANNGKFKKINENIELIKVSFIDYSSYDAPVYYKIEELKVINK